MRKFIVFVLVVLILAGATGGAVYFWQTQEKGRLEEKFQKEIAILKKQAEKLKSTKVSLEKKLGKLREKVEPEGPVISVQRNIKVTSPKSGATITSPVTISGEARVFEGTLQIRVKNVSGKVIGQGFTTATMGAPEWGTFKAKLNFTTLTKTQKGNVEVYTLSAATGEVDEIATIPVTLKGK